jgi:hypothetical protein
MPQNGNADNGFPRHFSHPGPADLIGDLAEITCCHAK